MERCRGIGSAGSRALRAARAPCGIGARPYVLFRQRMVEGGKEHRAPDVARRVQMRRSEPALRRCAGNTDHDCGEKKTKCSAQRIHFPACSGGWAVWFHHPRLPAGFCGKRYLKHWTRSPLNPTIIRKGPKGSWDDRFASDQCAAVERSVGGVQPERMPRWPFMEKDSRCSREQPRLFAQGRARLLPGGRHSSASRRARRRRARCANRAAETPGCCRGCG